MPDQTTVRTVCRSCWVNCGIVLTMDHENRIVSSRGDKDHPRTQGYICPKGTQVPFAHHRPDRLDYPMLHGERSTWETVMDDFADKVEAAIARNGPNGFGIHSGSGSDTIGTILLRKLLTALGSEQLFSALTVDIAPILRAAELVSGITGELLPTWVEEDEAVRLLIFCGSNPVVSHGYAGAGGMADARRTLSDFRGRGGKIWVIDPVETRTARLADRHVAPIPGTDPLILAWLVREVLTTLPEDAPARRTTRPEELAALGVALKPFDLATVADITGIAAPELQALLADIRAAGRIAFPGGTGMGFGPFGVVGEWLRWCLLILTDSLEQPGGMWFDPGWPHKLEERETWYHAPPEGRFGSPLVSRPELSRIFGGTPSVALADEIEQGPLRTLLVLGGNPLTAIPQPGKMERAFRSLDALGSIDIVASPVARMATHVLPSTGQLERLDLNTIGVHTPHLAYPVVQPGGERRGSWYALALLSRRLGVMKEVFGEDDLDLAKVTEEDLLRRTFTGGRHSFDELREAGVTGVSYPRMIRWAIDRAIPDGKWRIVPAVLVERLPELLRNRTSPQYPLLLTCGRQDRRVNSVENPSRERDAETAELRISPQDAATHGLSAVSRARVVSEDGALTVDLAIDARIRPGAVNLPHGWYDVNVCHLTPGFKTDPLTVQPQMTAIPVRVETA